MPVPSQSVLKEDERVPPPRPARWVTILRWLGVIVFFGCYIWMVCRLRVKTQSIMLIVGPLWLLWLRGTMLGVRKRLAVAARRRVVRGAAVMTDGSFEAR